MLPYMFYLLCLFVMFYVACFITWFVYVAFMSFCMRLYVVSHVVVYCLCLFSMAIESHVLFASNAGKRKNTLQNSQHLSVTDLGTTFTNACVLGDPVTSQTQNAHVSGRLKP